MAVTNCIRTLDEDGNTLLMYVEGNRVTMEVVGMVKLKVPVTKFIDLMKMVLESPEIGLEAVKNKKGIYARP